MVPPAKSLSFTAHEIFKMPLIVDKDLWIMALSWQAKTGSLLARHPMVLDHDDGWIEPIALKYYTLPVEAIGLRDDKPLIGITLSMQNHPKGYLGSHFRHRISILQ